MDFDGGLSGGTITLSTFPGLTYELVASDVLGGVTPVSGSGFVADDFSKTMAIVLFPPQRFVLARLKARSVQ